MWTENDTKLISSTFKTSHRVVKSTLFLMVNTVMQNKYRAPHNKSPGRYDASNKNSNEWR
jgi:hypothetical protein